MKECNSSPAQVLLSLTAFHKNLYSSFGNQGIHLSLWKECFTSNVFPLLCVFMLEM